ncbi:MAG: hypothetical protein E7222_13120 [Clostridiales bacterium]|nr:hypothetical protein [Clostridiales bacterium]
MSNEEYNAICKKLVNRISEAAKTYPKTYSNKIYDAVTIDEGIGEVLDTGIRKGLEMAILIIEADKETESEDKYGNNTK